VSDPARPLTALERGDRLPEFTLRITSEEVRAYLEATGEQHEAWDRLVPPLAIGALVLAGLMDRIEVPDGAVHTGQEYEFRRAVAHNEPLEVSIALAQRSQRRGAIIAVFEAEWRAGDEVAGTGRTSVLIAPGGIAE
jgi:hypothetical protein